MPKSLNHNSLKFGYVPLIDSAPILIAEDQGFFEDEDTYVTLSEEVGWATVRDKISHRELDAASTLIGLPYALHNGVGCYETKMVVPLIINANGNTITLTNEINPNSLNKPEEIAAILNERAALQSRKWTFATVNPYSSHLILLFQWLNTYLKDYISEIELVFIPPQLCPDLLSQGMIDGFCTGEPWGLLAEKTGAGRIVSSSLELSPNHPEKVLTVPQRTLKLQEENVIGMSKAIKRACEFCDDPDNLDTVVNILSKLKSLQMSSADIEKCFSKTFSDSPNQSSLLHKFSGVEVNKPTPAKEQWVLKGLKEAGLFRKKIIATGQIMNPDLLF